MHRYKSKNILQTVLCMVLLCTILLIAINPSTYIASTSNGIMVWANVILPSLLPFFFLTKLLCNFDTMFSFTKIFSKPMNKLYNCPSISSYVATMSIISGYPIGAKLISEFFENKYISSGQAHRMISFCSTSGPLFIIGSVGVGFFGDAKLGIIIFISHILSSLVNGLIYRKYKYDSTKTHNTNLALNTQSTLSDCMYNTIMSVMLVGGFIAISFVFIDILENLKVLSIFSSAIDAIIPNTNIGKPIVSGILEVTSGCLELSKLPLNTRLLTTLCCGLISFGGISIHLQSIVFLKKCGIKYKYFLITKTTHAILSMCICGLICMF